MNKNRWGLSIPKNYVVLDAAGGVYWRDDETSEVCYAPMKDNGTVAWDDGGELDERVDDELDNAAKTAVQILDGLIAAHKMWMDMYNTNATISY